MASVNKRPRKQKTSDRFFDGLIEGLEEVAAHVRGDIKLAERHYDVTPPVDVKKIRTSLQLSQSEFARRYSFPLRTLQDWELGRSRPLAPVRAYLLVIEKHPAMVEKVLRGQQAIRGAA